MANPQSQYYPFPPGGPFLADADYPALPRTRHTNFDTEKTIEDRVRKKTIFQGINELEMQGHIQNEIAYARTNSLGLYAYDDGSVNRFQDDGAPGR